MTLDPDLVYVVRPGERNDALRYSLRSLANLPHRRVFVAGYCPGWVRNVTVIPVQRGTDKHAAIETNLRAALQHPELGERCVYFNDDFYVMEPIREVSVMHGGPISNYNGHGALKQRMRKTQNCLSAFVDDALLRYDGVHVPLPFDRSALWSEMQEMPKGVLWRTWYGNVFSLGGFQVFDTKSRDGNPVPGSFMSSSPRSLHTLKHYLEDVLPRSSEYV